MEGNLDELTKANLPLVGKVARMFLNRGYEYEDMFQIGSIGLIKAIKKFEPERGLKFSTYAVPMIMGEIKRFLRDDWTIKVSRNVGQLGPRIHWAKSELSNELNREPTNKEIADKIGCKVEDIEAYSNASNICSLSGVMYESERADNDITLADKCKDDFNLEEEIIKRLEKQNLYACIDKLPGKQSTVIKLRLQEKSQMQIARILGISQVQVSRLESNAHIRLKKLLEKGDFMNINTEKQAFKLFEKGLSNEEAAQQLGLSARTIEPYRTNYNKSKGIFHKKNTKKMQAFELFKEGLEAKVVAYRLGIATTSAYSYKSEYNSIQKETDANNEKLVIPNIPELEVEEIEKIKEEPVTIIPPEVVKPKNHILKPVLFQGEIMEYGINEKEIKIKSEFGELLVAKGNLETLIEELQELKEVI